MNTILKNMLVVALLAIGFVSASAADKKHLGGPKGGRLLEKTEPKAEFFVEKDHTVTIAFYDNALKSVPVANQSVTVIADRGDKTRLEFEKKGDVLVSKSKLPEGDGYGIVVQFKQTAEAKPQN